MAYSDMDSDGGFGCNSPTQATRSGFISALKLRLSLIGLDSCLYSNPQFSSRCRPSATKLLKRWRTNSTSTSLAIISSVLQFVSIWPFLSLSFPFLRPSTTRVPLWLELSLSVPGSVRESYGDQIDHLSPNTLFLFRQAQA
ncbi:hypothetical protein B0H19DRAFT_1265494 [Mycena capillaripes]|nr:hypothetical protein B0H19DRAFT_1265494 [Mycena capillaripes]